ncbi:hypothetical protein AYO49_03865 [Verrucomicrobiaceae bacterium SCGC AG-212-N21]|nr:hypothetical protein AYO49_03865 [Verrucomicrobiaceae bacterium SCGC AG-212-N21]
MNVPPPIPSPARKKKRTLFIILLGILALLVVVAREVFIYTASLATVAASITTAEVLQVDEDVELPVAKGKKKTEAAKPGEFSLSMKWENGRSVFGLLGKDYEDEQAVIAELRKLRESVPNCQLIIRGDPRLPAVEIQRAMKVMSAAGFDTISFSAPDPK